MTTPTLAACAASTLTRFEEVNVKVILFIEIDEFDVGLIFKWDDKEKAWICKTDDDFMQELGALPIEETE